jgi:hypothetical protein
MSANQSSGRDCVSVVATLVTTVDKQRSKTTELICRFYFRVDVILLRNLFREYLERIGNLLLNGITANTSIVKPRRDESGPINSQNGDQQNLTYTQSQIDLEQYYL